MNQLPANTSILVSITAHYAEARLPWLQQALTAFTRYPCPVRIFANTNEMADGERARMEAIFPAGLNVTVRIQRGLRHPLDLAWRHKHTLANEFIGGSYTHFIYIEDDILIEPETFIYWVCMRPLLNKHGLIPGFLRVEQADVSGRWFATDQFGATRIDWMRVRRVGGMAFTNLESSYAACYVLDQELATEHVGSSSFNDLGSKAIKPNWDTRERAAMGVTFDNVPRFFLSRLAVPFDRRTLSVPTFAHVIHAPGNYAADPNSDLAKLPIDRLLERPTVGDFLRRRGRTAIRLLGLAASQGITLQDREDPGHTATDRPTT